MTEREILKFVDHTILDPKATAEEVYEVCQYAAKFHTASVCIPSCYVKMAYDYFKNRSVYDVRICTVVGFPNGNCSTSAKVFEAVQAIKDGADEIDMVINVGMLLDENYMYVSNEIKKVREAIDQEARIDQPMLKEERINHPVLKVIVESGLLTSDMIRKMCMVCALAGADFIKTSTGFNGHGGATLHAVNLMVGCASEVNKMYGTDLKVKASGGIKNIETAVDFIKAGASRLGTSGLVYEVIQNEYKQRINSDDYRDLSYTSMDDGLRIAPTPDFFELKKNCNDMKYPWGLSDAVLKAGSYILAVQAENSDDVIAYVTVFKNEDKTVFAVHESMILNNIWFNSLEVGVDEKKKIVSFIKNWADIKGVFCSTPSKNSMKTWINEE